MEPEVWVPLVTFFLGFGGSLALEVVRQRSEDSREERRWRTEDARLRAREERDTLCALQDALEHLRHEATTYGDKVLTKKNPSPSDLATAYRKAQILWSRLPAGDAQEAARALAAHCLTIVDFDESTTLEEQGHAFNAAVIEKIDTANEAIARRLQAI